MIIPQDGYDKRQKARRARYELRAEKARRESEAAARQSERMPSIIPVGQPIDVGHYPEKWDRHYSALIGQTPDEAISLDKKAAHYEEKVETVGNGGISSDAPDVLELLEKKLAEHLAVQARMKEINAAFSEGRRRLAYPWHDAS